MDNELPARIANEMGNEEISCTSECFYTASKLNSVNSHTNVFKTQKKTVHIYTVGRSMYNSDQTESQCIATLK